MIPELGKQYALTGFIFDPDVIEKNNNTFIYVGIDEAEGMHEFKGSVDGGCQWVYQESIDDKYSDISITLLS